MDEPELLECIRCLVLEATGSEDEESIHDSNSSKHHHSSATNSNEEDNNPEYQALVQQVEEKLIQFLEEQIKLEHTAATGGSTIQSSRGNATLSPGSIVLPIHQAHAYPCSDTHKVLPAPPKDWPQRPVMIRPTPGSSTKIRGIRYASERDYKSFPGFCAGCILPVNNGTEAPGKSLVIDFESSHFVGTLLMRIKDIPSASTSTSTSSTTTSTTTTSYFDHKKRKFQGLVKGKFKTALPMSECITGQTFDRRAGTMPAKWVVSTFVKFVSALAPQLETTIDGDNPRFLVPLVATAHTVLAKDHEQQPPPLLLKTVNTLVQNDNLFNYSVYGGSTEMEEPVQEPPASSELSVMQDVHRDLGMSIAHNDTNSSISSRMKARKKAYNAVSAKKSPLPCFSLDKEYTFEFYQHLLVFHEPEFALDMGRPIGKVPLSPITNGQPIKFMSAHYQDPHSGLLDSLWSFDIWHESMYELAKQAIDDKHHK